LGASVGMRKAPCEGLQYDKVNYVSLMADPNVHFHVIPRYGSARVFHGTEFIDAGWPKPPDMTFTQPANLEQLEALRKSLADLWLVRRCSKSLPW
jgi:diadenosine tetraphosphate (Ap4A) HIT family hydrolase